MLRDTVMPPTLATASSRRIVQFLHAGPERIPDSLDSLTSGWNMGRDHKRRFVSRQGAYLANPISEKAINAEIGFWCEWEPQARVLRQIPKSERQSGFPRFIYHPFYNLRGLGGRASTTCGPTDGGCMNTDPFVFGDRFYYSNCRQGSLPSLRSLDRGSIILFGSRLNWEFVLDTVFVVDEAYPIAGEGDLRHLRSHLPPAFFDVTLRWFHEGAFPLTLYSGATPSARVDDMFSFFPAVPIAHMPNGFRRPSLALDGIISPGMTQGAKFTSSLDGQLLNLNLNEVKRVWESVVKQVTGAHLCLGVCAELPEREG